MTAFSFVRHPNGTGVAPCSNSPRTASDCADQFRSQHRQTFIKITHDWPESKHLTFARLLIEYADASVALTIQRQRS